MDYFNGVFKGKTILVTGHTGFKGSWLSLWLQNLGANVIGYALDPYTKEDNFIVTGLSNKIEDIRGDIRDYQKLTMVFEKYNPEFVFHLAAQPLVRLSYEQPRETYEINIMGTVNILEAARKSHSVKVLINVTSDKCYENKEWIWGYRENDPMGGYDPYSSSKGCAELVISAYTRSFFNSKTISKNRIAAASVRAGNVIGGGDWSKDRIIPDSIRSLRNNQAIQIRNPNAVRPWQHVLEPLTGYLLLASKLYQHSDKYVGAWNFGPEYSSVLTVKQIVEKLISKWGSGSWHDLSNLNALHEANLLSLDISKARNLLKWQPVLNIDTALDYVVEWYKALIRNDDMYNVAVKQIKNYMKKRVKDEQIE